MGAEKSSIRVCTSPYLHRSNRWPYNENTRPYLLQLSHKGSLMARRQVLHFVPKPLWYVYIPAAISKCLFFPLQVKNLKIIHIMKLQMVLYFWTSRGHEQCPSCLYNYHPFWVKFCPNIVFQLTINGATEIIFNHQQFF